MNHFGPGAEGWVLIPFTDRNCDRLGCHNRAIQILLSKEDNDIQFYCFEHGSSIQTLRENKYQFNQENKREINAVYKNIASKIKSYTINSDHYIPVKMREYIEQRDKWECIYCEEGKFEVIDFVIPEDHGGPVIQENLVASCRSCNLLKGSSFNERWLTVAFNHLLRTGENLDWIDEIFKNEDK